ncbi:MAG: hypothetical protein ACPGWR_07430 [Ardenticatenaceae bacterium]
MIYKIRFPITIVLVIGFIWSMGLSIVMQASSSSAIQSPTNPVDCPHNEEETTDLDSDCRPISPEPLVPAVRSAANRDSNQVLYEASPDEIWITRPTIGQNTQPAPPALVVNDPSRSHFDSTPPSNPSNLVVENGGLFALSGSWNASFDPESGIQYYAYAIGTGTTQEEQANVKGWQSTGTATNFHVGVTLSENQPYYVSLYAANGVGVFSQIVRYGPFTVSNETLGEPNNQIGFEFSPIGYDQNGEPTEGWSEMQEQEIGNFVTLMLPVLYDMYGPPSVSYMVTLVRNERNTNSAIFYPNSDEIHLGDNAPYQLITHEFIHAWRNDRILSSDEQWQYNPTLSGFEEGFAQAASYDAMTEFARRYPGFGLSQMIYQSSHEWDYDFYNLPELRTKDFWSDESGMNLFWIRYEVAAAAIAKIQIEHPNFYSQFNEEYYRRLNEDSSLRVSRELVVDIIESIAPRIEGKPAAQWIDEQHIFASTVYPGTKIWLYTEHYPSEEYYFIFNRVYFYETFASGSDWKQWDGTQWNFHRLNGSQGHAKLYDYNKNLVWERDLLIEPVQNPPDYRGFGSEEINLTTKASHLPWPGGDATKFITELTSFGLYTLDVEFVTGMTTIRNSFDFVIGEDMRNATGVFGAVRGANGGQINLNHRNYEPEEAVPVINGTFGMTRTWASAVHSDTDSIDSEPGFIDITYIDAEGNIYTDTRTINYGSWMGNQLFRFDVAKMHHVTTAPITTPTPTPTPTPTLTPSSTPIYTGTVAVTPTPSSTPGTPTLGGPTLTPTPSSTSTYTGTVTVTPTPSSTPSPPTLPGPSLTPTPSNVPTYTATVTVSPTLTVTATPTIPTLGGPTFTPTPTIPTLGGPTSTSTPSGIPSPVGANNLTSTPTVGTQLDFELYLPIVIQ